jgi:uncharacterized protein YbjT (DUF2867 family)
MTQTVLLVGGTGNLGSKIATELARKDDITLRALVRSRTASDPKKQSPIDHLAKLGAELVEGDLNEKVSLERACTGVDTVMSTLAGWDDVVITGQLNLLEAASNTGVDRFIPSDYSYDYTGLKLGDNYLSDQRIKVAEAVKNSGLNYTFIANGVFMEVFFAPFSQVFDFKAGTVEYWGDADTKFDLTAIPNVAKYAAEAVVDPGAVNTMFQFAGDVMSMNDVIAAYEAVTGQKLSVHRKGSVDDLKQWIENTKANNPDPWAVIPMQYHYGMMSGKAKLRHLVNDRYPHIQPIRVSALIAQLDTTSISGTGTNQGFRPQ